MTEANSGSARNGGRCGCSLLALHALQWGAEGDEVGCYRDRVNPFRDLCYPLRIYNFFHSDSMATEPDAFRDEPRYPRKGWIGVDLDGTLAEHARGQDYFTIGKPVPQMLRRVLHWLETGREVKIFTARAADAFQRAAVRLWLKENGLPDLEITDRKDFRMVALWDDRAVGVRRNLGTPVLSADSASKRRTRRKVAGSVDGAC